MEERTSAIFRPQTAGQLSYLITMAYQYYLKRQKFSYSALATVAGVLILTLFEFVRRIVNNYEDQKIKEHGDVFYVGQKPVEPVKTECSYVGWENFEDGDHVIGPRGYCYLCGEKP